jgi:CO/xanthine dehydrogenase FAD-binding subunit
MDLAVSRFLRPTSLEEALRWFADQPHARPIAGGTDLVVQMRAGRRRIDTLLELGALGLAGVRELGGGIEIGACTAMEAIGNDPRVRAVCPALAEAALLVGAWPIQCRATLGGNLANASPAADTAPPLLAADARVLVASVRGEREVPVTELFVGPGATSLEAGELIVAVRVPAWERPRGSAVDRFVKVGPRREQIISVVSLAVRIALAGGVIADVRLALGSVAPRPLRARAAEQFLLGKPPSAAVRQQAAEVIQQDIAPIDDVRAPASYRRLATAVLLDRALAEVAGV